MTYEAGQTVTIKTAHGDEKATILRWVKKVHGPRDSLPKGYHPVRFHADGAKLMVHEDGFNA